MAQELLQHVQASFAHGEISPDLFGRVDIQAYGSSLKTSRNGFIKTEGAWSNRQGSQFIGAALNTTPLGSVLIPFVFSATQSYVIEMGPGTCQVFANGAFITSVAGAPYLLGELQNLRWTQSANTLTIVHPAHPPYELTRQSATVFTLAAASYNNGPFIPQNTDGTTLVYANAQSGTVTLTCTAPIFKPGHVNSLFYLQQQDISPIPPWQANYTLTIGGASPVGMLTSSNLKNYKCVAFTANGTNQILTGAVAPNHQYGTVWDGTGSQAAGSTFQIGVGWQFTDFGYGVVKITGYTDAMHVTGVVQSVIPGQPALLPAMVVGGPTTAFGPFNFTGTGVQVTFSPLTATTSVDPNRFYVTVGGIYVQPPNYSITAGAITFITAPANGAAISVQQLNTPVAGQTAGLYATSFWAFGAFSDVQGYPSTVSYFPDRLIFAATPQQPVGVFASQTSQYKNFAVSQPTVNSDAFTVFLNSRQLNAISDLVPLQDLIIGTSNTMWRLWPGETGTALGPLAIASTPQAFVGESPNCAAILYGDSMLYPTYGGRRIREMIYQFAYNKYIGTELTAYSRHLIPLGAQILEMQYAPDPWSQLFCQISNGQIITCTYVRDQEMTAWSRWDTAGAFEDLVVVPENSSYALYVLTRRVIKGATVRYVERMSQWEWQTIYDYKFMDCSITYDGRNTSANTMTLSGGTTWLSGDVGTLMCSGTSGWANFQSTDVTLSNQIQLFDAAGNLCRLLITAVNSLTSASVRFVDPVPADLRNTSALTWTFARTKFTGALQLAGQTVACLADSNVICGKQGAPLLTVGLDGSVMLPYAGGVVTVGLQYLSDFATLPLNQPSAQSIRERAKGIPGVYLDVTGTRGLVSGTSFDSMSAFPERAFEPYLSPTNLQEGIIDNRIYSDFDSEQSLCVRQPYPLPCTIRMAIPSVNVGEPVG